MANTCVFFLICSCPYLPKNSDTIYNHPIRIITLITKLLAIDKYFFK